MKTSLTTNDIGIRVAKRHANYEWIFFPEFRSCTGFGARRSADALAVRIYGDYSIHGFEYKISRTDWVKEMQDPDKADTFKVYCDRWWLVVADKEIVRPGELPQDWGLLVPYGQKLRVAKGAPRLNPESFCREMQASLMQRLYQNAHSDETRRVEIDAAWQAGKERAENTAKYEITRTIQVKEEAENAIVKFEEASGIRIANYNASDKGKLFKEFLAARMDDYAIGELRRQAQKLVHTGESMIQFADAFAERGCE